MKYFWRKWRNIALKLAPSVFKRHQSNKSYYSQSEKTIFWTIEILIGLREDKNETREMHSWLIQSPTNENILIRDIIQNFIDDKTKYYSSKSHLFINENKEKLVNESSISVYIEKCNSEEFKKLITPKAPGNGGNKQEESYKAEEEPPQFKLPEAIDNNNKYDLKIGKAKLLKVDKSSSMKDILESSIVYEYPTLYLLI